jgi:uncharacterized OB-fold protein
MQADYLYTNGVAGDRFFKNLMKKGTFLATRCPKCRKVLFPPRLFCEDCFVEITDKGWLEVPPKGTIRLWTEATIDTHGEKLDEPKVIALIDIDKTDGAMLGIIKTKNLKKEFTGMKVKAVLKPKSKREGTLKDILHFE